MADYDPVAHQLCVYAATGEHCLRRSCVPGTLEDTVQLRTVPYAHVWGGATEPYFPEHGTEPDSGTDRDEAGCERRRLWHLQAHRRCVQCIQRASELYR